MHPATEPVVDLYRHCGHHDEPREVGCQVSALGIDNELRCRFAANAPRKLRLQSRRHYAAERAAEALLAAVEVEASNFMLGSIGLEDARAGLFGVTLRAAVFAFAGFAPLVPGDFAVVPVRWPRDIRAR